MLVMVGLAMCAGAGVGVLWTLIAPTVTAVVGESSITLTEHQSGRMFGREGILGLLSAGAGIASAVAARGWLHRAGPFAVLALAVSGFLGSVVAWRTGVWLGPDPVETLTGLTVSGTVPLPFELRSYGILLVWPIAAVFVTLWMLALAPARPEHADDTAVPVTPGGIDAARGDQAVPTSMP